MMIFQKIILYFCFLMLSYKIINLYIEWYLHYTLDYYINYEYNIYTKLVFISLPCPPPQDKFQVMSLLQFYSHKLSFLMITLKIFIESLLTIWMLVWIFFFFFAYTSPPPKTWNPGFVPRVKYIQFWWLSSVVRGIKIYTRSRIWHEVWKLWIET